MITKIYNVMLLFIVCAIFGVSVNVSNAEETYTTGTLVTTANFRWNNENWFTMEHPQVTEFTVRDDRSAYGMLETGVSFTQENVENELNLRIQRFVLQDHYHYIINGEVVYSLEDFSIQLARAYEAQTGSVTL